MREFAMSETESELTQTEENQQVEAVDNTYLVKERFEIDYNSPLPAFDANGAKAFAVKDKINPQRDLFALICDNDTPPRLSLLPYLKSIDHPNLLKLVEFGVVEYAPQKTHNMALIYRAPTGPKVSEFISGEKLTTERFKSLVVSLVSGCEALKTYNITHRAIRLDNLFYKDTEATEIVLGDCAASFPALFQPDAYETIESLLCLPQGRGNGTVKDDIYACAVALLGIVLQKEIDLDMSTPEILRLKLRKGSLVALTEGEKLNSQYIAVLKGMLEDSLESRWNGAQIYNYLEGKANSFTNSEGAERSMRALTIGGEKYYTAKTAALAMLENQQDALAQIRNGKLLEWIKNGLENEKLHNKIEKLILTAKEKENNRLLVPQVCIYLDSSLPIKAGDMFLFPTGLSKAIFYYLKKHLSLDVFHNSLSGDIMKLWYQEQPYIHAPTNGNEFKVYMARSDYGYGIERIMYDFDEDIPCTSELVNKEFVNSPSRLLRALDNNYNPQNEKPPFDKNIVAYLRCKLGKKIDGLIADINAHQDALKISAVIRLYASIQSKNGPVQVYNLTKWLLKSSKPIIQTFHNLKYRKFLERELVKISKNGKIVDLSEILEDEDAKQKDRTEYSEALKKVNILVTEKNKILSGGSKLEEEAKDIAIKFGSTLSVLTMLASFVFSILYCALQ